MTTIDLRNISPTARRQLLAAAAQRAAVNLSARRRTVEVADFRGACLTAQTCYDSEVVLVGPAGTGKTYANLVYINRQMWAHPNLRVLMARKVRADLAQSAMVTFERDVLGYDNPICQGATREHRATYQYPNGSIMVIGGLDRPEKVLSSEWDIIYVPECNQLTENDWEMIGMRLARAGNYPYPQLRGDTNPDRPDHWLKARIDKGLTTGLLSTHKDNPRFWDGGQWTAQGEAYLARLSRLTGVRRARYFEGQWAKADGAVYDEWNEAVHMVDPFDIPPEWPRYRAIDFGYTNPFVCLWFARDPDGRLYLYRELYRTQRLVEDHASDIKRLSAGERITFTVADHDAEDRATLSRHGIQTRAARKEVRAGVQAVQERLRVQPDGKPRLFVMRGALVEPDPLLVDDGAARVPYSIVGEFTSYVWSDKRAKEEPVKEYDHALDALRYMVMELATSGRRIAVAVR